MVSDCVFCKIVQGKIPGRIIYQDDLVTAFHDAHPVAPTHILIVPNRHISSLNELTETDEPLVGHMFKIASQLAKEAGVDQQGFRSIINTGIHGGQTIFHLHLHLIGGQTMRHPIG